MRTLRDHVIEFSSQRRRLTRMTRSAIRLAIAAAIAGALLGGCGNSKDGRRDPPDSPTLKPILTPSYVADQVAGVKSKGPARVVLGFWRDIQFANYPSAYKRLSLALRAQIDYRRFARVLDAAQPYFQTIPRIESIEPNGAYTTVYLMLQADRRPSPEDTPFSFNVAPDGGPYSWRIATDPRNVLGLAPPTVAVPRTETAPRTGTTTVP